MDLRYILAHFTPLLTLAAATSHASAHFNTLAPAPAARAVAEPLPDDDAAAGADLSLWSARHPLRETRAVWLATIGGIDWPRTKATDASSRQRQQKELTDMLDAYERANINTVILQTRVRASLIYPSAIEPWEMSLTGHAGQDPGYDPLAFCIEECHKRGMELHAWIVCIPVGTQQRQAAYGKASIVSRHPRLVKKAGAELFMQPGMPETAEHIASICREITERYDIDGISLDYIRYPEPTYRFSDDALCPPGRRADRAQWRRDNITRIVKRVHDVVKPLKPWVKLSSSPIGKYADTRLYSAGGWNCRDAVWQDPKLWLERGYQDMLFPMMYFLGDNFYPFLCDWQQTSSGHPVVPGLGIYFLDPREGRWSLNDVRAEMHAARSCGIGGVAFYRSDFLTRNVRGLLDCVEDEFFPYPALTARMTWQGDTLPPAAPRWVAYRDGVVSWGESGDASGAAGSSEASGAGAHSGSSAHSGSASVLYNLYGSASYPVDTADPANLLKARLRGTSCELDARAMRMRFYAVTACDRMGNESEAAQQERPSHEAARPKAAWLINRSLAVKKKKR